MAAHSYLARSLDGGRTFGPAVAISGEGFLEAVQGPGGRVGLVDGPTTTRAGLFAADGSSAAAEGSTLGPFLEGVFTDIAAQGEEVLAAGSDAKTTHAFRLGAGGDPNNVAAWQQLDPAKGREPALAGLPGTFAVMLEPSGPAAGKPVRAAPRGRGVVTARDRSSRPSTTTATSSPATPRAA